jgi:glycerophosphoryl diester phosphodiesterase
MEAGLEAIELDVWLSKDGIPVVAHGGYDGNLKDYGLSNDFIYDWTYSELQTLVAGENESIPALE